MLSVAVKEVMDTVRDDAVAGMVKAFTVGGVVSGGGPTGEAVVNVWSEEVETPPASDEETM